MSSPAITPLLEARLIDSTALDVGVPAPSVTPFIPWKYLSKSWEIEHDKPWSGCSGSIEYPHHHLRVHRDLVDVGGVSFTMHIGSEDEFIHVHYRGKTDPNLVAPSASGLKLRVNLRDSLEAAKAWDILQGTFYTSKVVKGVKFKFTERFANNSQFTVYLYEITSIHSFDLEAVRRLVDDIEQRLREASIVSATVASDTDMLINSYVSARFDHTFSAWIFGSRYREAVPGCIFYGANLPYNYQEAFNLAPGKDDLSVRSTELLLRTFHELICTGKIEAEIRKSALASYTQRNVEILAARLSSRRCLEAVDADAELSRPLGEFSGEFLAEANKYYEDESRRLDADPGFAATAPMLTTW